MNLSLFLCSLPVLISLASCSNRVSADAEIIPAPLVREVREGSFTFDARTTFAVENQEQEKIAQTFACLFTASAGFTPSVTCGRDAEGTVRFSTDTTLLPESYALFVSPSEIRITAADTHGFFYALQSLRMQLPPAVESRQLVPSLAWKVPAMTLRDTPRFGYRGLMLDVVRYFMPKENVMKIIDAMAMLKLNYLHLHLVDDNGWRLEIKQYPKLTEVGAWRVYREGDFAQHKNPKKGEPTPVGGFYTQEDIREMIAYAAARQVEIIPEIEMPAHTNSSLAAYPELACPVVKDFIGVLPGLGGHAAEIIYCAGNEQVFTFLEGVIDEVAALFPAPYIHLGGDEAAKTNWRKCPLCQARMKAEGYSDIEDLQGYFMNRMSDYVKSKGKQVMGWDELTNSRIPDGAIIYGWQGMGEAGYKAGKAGHPFIMTPAQVLYLIRYQGPQWFEPRTYFGNNTLKNVYEYEPVQPDWEESVRTRLLGLQASLWTEFVGSPEEAEYLIFPRLAALAEAAWSNEKNWPGFLKRLDRLTARYDRMGISYARSMFNLDHRVDGENDTLKVSLACIRPDMEIRYTIDGEPPQATSPLYTDTLRITKSTTVRAATFRDGQQMGQSLTLPLIWNKATAKRVLQAPAGQAYRLVNGLRGSDKHSDFEWCGWNGEDVSVTVDLGKTDSIHQVILGCITNYGMGVQMPARITVSISDDNRHFRQLGKQSFSPQEIFREGIRIEDQIFDTLDASGRYIKIDLKNPGLCPDDHTRPGQKTWVYLDEIQVF